MRHAHGRFPCFAAPVLAVLLALGVVMQTAAQPAGAPPVGGLPDALRRIAAGESVARRAGGGPELAVGLLQRPDGGVGTAFLVTPCHAVTALRVIAPGGHGELLAAVGRGASWTLRIGPPTEPRPHARRAPGTSDAAWRAMDMRNADFSLTGTARPVAWSRWDVREGDEVRGARTWAILELSPCLGGPAGADFLPEAGPADVLRLEATLVGFPSDRATAETTLALGCFAEAMGDRRLAEALAVTGPPACTAGGRMVGAPLVHERRMYGVLTGGDSGRGIAVPMRRLARGLQVAGHSAGATEAEIRRAQDGLRRAAPLVRAVAAPWAGEAAAALTQVAPTGVMNDTTRIAAAWFRFARELLPMTGDADTLALARAASRSHALDAITGEVNAGLLADIAAVLGTPFGLGAALEGRWCSLARAGAEWRFAADGSALRMASAPDGARWTLREAPLRAAGSRFETLGPGAAGRTLWEIFGNGLIERIGVGRQGEGGGPAGFAVVAETIRRCGPEKVPG